MSDHDDEDRLAPWEQETADHFRETGWEESEPTSLDPETLRRLVAAAVDGAREAVAAEVLKNNNAVLIPLLERELKRLRDIISDQNQVIGSLVTEIQRLQGGFLRLTQCGEVLDHRLTIVEVVLARQVGEAGKGVQSDPG
jgi:hypothetical protein